MIANTSLSSDDASLPRWVQAHPKWHYAPMYRYTDEELMLRAFNGDENTFNILYIRLNQRLYRYLRYPLWGDLTQVDDILMDVWERILKAHKKILDAYNRAPAEFKFTCYLFKVARNRVIEVGRKPKPSMVSYDPHEEGSAEPKGSSYLELSGLERFMESEQMKNAALEALDKLPLDQREAFLLYVTRAGDRTSNWRE